MLNKTQSQSLLTTIAMIIAGLTLAGIAVVTLVKLTQLG